MSTPFTAVDLSIIGATLGLELTADLSMPRIQSAVHNTVAGMNKQEREQIPPAVWGMIDTMFPSAGILSYCTAVPKTGNESTAFSVQKDGSTAIILPNRQTPQTLIRSLEAKPRFVHWCQVHHPNIAVSSATIRITHSLLQDMGVKFIRKLVESW